MRCAFIFSLGVFLAVKSAFAACPAGSFQGLGNDQRCFQIQTTKQPSPLADASCQRLGGQLASVHDGFNNAYLGEKISQALNVSSVSFWLGGTTSGNGSWTWIDGTPFDYAHWAAGQPQAGPQCMMSNSKTGAWRAAQCYESGYSICTVPSTSGTPLTNAPTGGTNPPTQPPTGGTSCPGNWSYFAGSSSCYLFIGNMQPYSFDPCSDGNCYTQSDAETKCASLGTNAHLTSIHSLDEENFIKNNVFQNTTQAYWVWIGLTTADSGQTFTWSDGTPFDYNHWGDGEPDGIDEASCVHANHHNPLDGDGIDDGNWFDDYCTVYISGVCKMPASS